MVNKIDFNAKNLTSNAGIFLLLENAKTMESLNSLKKTLCLTMNRRIRSR